MISVSTFLAVKALLEEGHAVKAIARRLKIDRRTVRHYRKKIARGAALPERARVPSKIDPFADRILADLVAGRSAVQIYQDLGTVEGFDASYELVKKFCAEHRGSHPEVYRRLTFRPGEEAQVDFGDVGWV